jgi:DNA replication and repair protein RecF
MYVKYIELKNYRNYRNLSLELSSGTNIFVGDNAQGKTNILESIYFCSLGKSHRTNKDKEVIIWGEKEAYVSVYIAKERLDKKINIKIFKEGKKGATINSIKVNKLSELIGTFNAVMFSPEDLKIVKESPTYRRKFLDIELSKLDRKYYNALVQYNKILNEKNTILKKWKEKDSLLDVYDSQLSKYGAYIITKRFEYLNMLGKKASIIHKEITTGKEEIGFKYLTFVKNLDNRVNLIQIESGLREQLNLSRQKDIEKKISSVGPHRDDFLISINNIDTRIFGSQGQQRTSVLSIKFASLEIIKDVYGEYPVLLLDDVLSELDINRQKYILNSISKFQTIITCTGIMDIKKYLKDKINIYHVKEGSIDIEILE